MRSRRSASLPFFSPAPRWTTSSNSFAHMFHHAAWLPVTDLPSIAALREEIARAVGPAPWYWKTFPAFKSSSGQSFVWTHQEEPGPLGFVVSLSLEQEPEKPRLALNTYG